MKTDTIYIVVSGQQKGVSSWAWKAVLSDGSVYDNAAIAQPFTHMVSPIEALSDAAESLHSAEYTVIAKQAYLKSATKDQIGPYIVRKDIENLDKWKQLAQTLDAFGVSIRDVRQPETREEIAEIDQLKAHLRSEASNRGGK